MVARPTIAVVSPFLDKRHGTERCVAEQVERLALDYGYEIHVYSHRLADIAGVQNSWRARCASAQNGVQPVGRVIWHRVPEISGPYLVKYVWWFFANWLWRWRDRKFYGLRPDLVYSPGVNCPDADVVSVHIVFAEFFRQVHQQLHLRRNPPRTWPRLLHRRLYYRLVVALEKCFYTPGDLFLVGVSRKVAADLARFYGQNQTVRLLYHGLDLRRFNPEIRSRLRREARQSLRLSENAFALLLVGNDWKKKGLPVLIDAVIRLRNPSLVVLVVGQDAASPYQVSIERHGLGDQIRFLPLRPDVEFYYAAADLYVGPSLEDAFGLPPAEAMACGLPVIASRQAGVNEIICDGQDGFVLEDPTDSGALARLIARLYADPELRHCVGENAAQKARQYTWERNVEQLDALFRAFLEQKHQACPQRAEQRA